MALPNGSVAIRRFPYTRPMEYRIGQVAGKVHRSTATIRIWVAKGKMPLPTSVSDSREYRWDEDVINDWLQERQNPTHTPPTLPVTPVGVGE